MKTKMIVLGLLSAMLMIATPGCKDEDKDKEGCTDSNADNYDSNADKNAGCRYRYASNIDLISVPSNKPDGSGWDDGNGPDLKINYGKSSSSVYDYSTNTAEDAANTATLTPAVAVNFTNELWKFQLVDVDLIGNEVIASGTFNPLKATTNNTIEVVANGVTIRFKYTIQ